MSLSRRTGLNFSCRGRRGIPLDDSAPVQRASCPRLAQKMDSPVQKVALVPPLESSGAVEQECCAAV